MSGDETGSEKGRRRGANDGPKPQCSPPLAAKTPVATRARRAASVSSKPRPRPPPADPSQQGANLGTEPSGPSPPVAIACAEIVQLQRLRKFCITSQSRCDRSIESLIASVMGFRLDATEKDRKALFKAAKAHRERIEKGTNDFETDEGQVERETHSDPALARLEPVIRQSAASRKPWDDKRTEYEREMERLAMTLPVWTFVESVRGLGAKGLAIIVGEAGLPLGDYRTVSGLWKRLGLAVIDGERQRRKTNKDAAARHGYSPGRRAQIWAVCSDSLFRAQWRGADEEAGLDARPIGPYGEVYARRRIATAPRTIATADLPADSPLKWGKGRCHNDARRVMTKALVRDLYLAWKNEPWRDFDLRAA